MWCDNGPRNTFNFDVRWRMRNDAFVSVGDAVENVRLDDIYRGT